MKQGLVITRLFLHRAPFLVWILGVCCASFVGLVACKTGRAPITEIGPNTDGPSRDSTVTHNGGVQETSHTGGAIQSIDGQTETIGPYPHLDGARPSALEADVHGAHQDTRTTYDTRANTLPNTSVVIFVIDGMMADAAKTATQNGAIHLKFVEQNGVTVTTVRTPSPATRIELPGNIRPWGNATAGNVAMHTGTHLFEADSAGMDDIFLATKAAGIKSVYSGGDNNYAVFKTATFNYGKTMEDKQVVDHAIKHLKIDGARLFRLHLQRLRDSWTGASDKTNPTSAYIGKIIAADKLLGELIAALKEVGVWDNTYLIITSDHGMGGSRSPPHPPTAAASWEPYLAFYGPGLKQGATIPYAELPDIAVTTIHFFGLPSLKGHTGSSIPIATKGPTGTVLTNLFKDTGPELAHPRYIDQYLKSGAFSTRGDSYAPYRNFMLEILQSFRARAIVDFGLLDNKSVIGK